MEGSGPLVFPHCPLLAAAGPLFLYDEDEEEDEEKTDNNDDDYDVYDEEDDKNR